MTQQILFFTPVSKAQGLSTEDVVRVFENSDDLMGGIKTAVENAKDRVYVTWATVLARDNVKEIVNMEEAIKEQEILLRRMGPISDTHTNRIVGRTLAYKVLMHPETNTPGILHLNVIYADNPVDDKVWQEIQSGERRGSSVGGINTSASYVLDPVTGQPAKQLDGFHHLETASVDNPCNPYALNVAYSVVAKSNVSGSAGDKAPGQDNAHEIKKKKEECAMTDAVTKGEFETLKGDVAKMSDAVNKLVSKMDEKDKEKEEDAKKAVKKEAASIEGSASAPAPASPKPEESNDQNVFKGHAEMLAAAVAKSMAPLVDAVNKAAPVSTAGVARVGSNVQNVQKSYDDNTALDIAMGKKNLSWHEVNKMGEEFYGGN